MKSDVDLLGAFSLNFDKGRGVLHVVFQDISLEGNEDFLLAGLYRDKILALYAEHNDTVFATLVNTTAIQDRQHFISTEAREIYQDLFNHDQTGKVAIVAGAGVFSFLTKFIIGLFMKKKKTQFFSDSTVALAWLMKD